MLSRDRLSIIVIFYKGKRHCFKPLSPETSVCVRRCICVWTLKLCASMCLAWFWTEIIQHQPQHVSVCLCAHTLVCNHDGYALPPLWTSRAVQFPFMFLTVNVIPQWSSSCFIGQTPESQQGKALMTAPPQLSGLPLGTAIFQISEWTGEDMVSTPLLSSILPC